MDNRISDNQEKDDLISDPNLLLAVAMSMIDQNQGSGEEQDEQIAESSQNAGRNSSQGAGDNQSQANKGAPDEMIELSPIQDLAEKVRQKKLLSKEELGIITTSIQSKFTDLKEKSTHQRLTSEALNLIKRILEILSKNDNDSLLIQNTFPIILKFLTTLQSKASYDQAQYRYLRANKLVIPTSSLAFLNQSLAEWAPELYGIKSKPSSGQSSKVLIKQEEGSNVIVLPQNTVIEENDSLEKALEFVPIDYSTMTNMLHQHLQAKLMLTNVKDEEMSVAEDEEEKEGQSHASSLGKDYIEVCKEQMQKLKIYDLLSKSIDSFTKLYDKSLESMLQISSTLFPRLLRAIDNLPPLKLKFFPAFLTKRLIEKYQESYQVIQDSIKAGESQMDIDQQQENEVIQQNRKIDNQEIKDNLFIIAKCLEIMMQTAYQCEGSTLNLKPKIVENIESIIKDSSDFKYLLKLIQSSKKIAKELQQVTLAICQSLIQYHLNVQKENGNFPQDKLESYMIIATNIIRVHKYLGSSNSDIQTSAKKAIKKEPKQPDAQAKPAQEKQASGGIRTRNQAKKEQTSAQKDQSASKKSASAVKQEEVKGDKEKKQSKSQLVDIKDAYKIDSNDVLKHSLSILIMMIPQYLQIKNQNGEISLNKTLFKNIFKLAYFPSPLIARLVYGILAEFTKPAIKYSAETHQMISETLQQSLRLILESNTLTVFTLKLLILIKNLDLNLQLLQIMVKSSEELQQKKTPIKTFLEIYEGQNLRKYLLYIGIVSLIQNNKERRETLIESIFQEIEKQKEGQYFLNLHLMQVLMLSSQSLSKYKGVIGQFMIKLMADNEPDNSYVSLVSEVDKITLSILNSKDFIYDHELIQKFKERLDLQKFLHQIRNNLLTSIKSASDQKTLIITLLRQIIKINQEIYQQIQNQQYEELLQEFEKDRTNPFINSKIDKAFYQLNNKIIQKLKENQNIDAEELPFIQQQLKLLQFLSEKSSSQQISILESFLDAKDQQQNIGGVGDKDYAALLFDFIRLTNVNIKGKIQQQVVFVSNDESKIVQSIIDQPLLFKTIVGLQSQQDDENLYSHALSSIYKDEFQILISVCLLLKSIYGNLVQFVNTNTQEQLKDIVREIAYTLLQVKYENPFLEFSESTNAFDHDTSDKLLQKTGAINLANKDFQRIRQFDHSVSILFKAQEYLHKHLQNANENGKERRKFILTLCNEVSGVLNASSFKSSEDIRLISDYFMIQGENSQFFKGIMRSNKDDQLGTILWENSFQYLQQSLIDFNESKDGAQIDQINEKKGGLELTISFSNNKPPVKRGTLSKRSLATKQQQQTISNVIELPVIKPQPSINLVAQKVFNFISDIIMVEKDSQKAEAIVLSYYLRQSFLQCTSQESSNFILTLFQLSVVPLLKKIISSLITNNPDSDQKNQLRDKIFSILIQNLQTQDIKEELVFLTIEIIQIISENNTQFLRFINDHILKNENLIQNAPTKFLILDLLCQLGQSKFSKVDGDQYKYSVQQIMDQRKKIQQDKIAQAQKKKILEQQKQQQEDQELELSNITGLNNKREPNTNQETNIEGFKQEKFTKDDTQHYQKYMEKPEDICTFSQTKKDFRNQHWYFCYTCNLTNSNGCCSVCARRCHKGHHVVYSRKSNFFCDCGESGKCTSLSSSNQQPGDKPIDQWADARPQTGRRRNREEEYLQEKGLFFKNLAQVVNPGAPRQLDDGGRLFTGLQQAQGLFGMASPSYLQKYEKFELADEDEEEEASLIFQHIGGMLERPTGESNQNFSRGAQALAVGERKYGQFQFLSESSEDDLIMAEDNDQLIENQGDHPLSDLRSVHRIMKLIQKDSKPLQPPSISFLPNEGQRPLSMLRKNSSSSVSQLSQINPVEDPLSDGGSTPMHTQQFTHEKEEFKQNLEPSQIATQAKDDEMEDLALIEEVCNLLRQEQGQYDQLFQYLLNIIDDQISSSQQNVGGEIDEIMSSVSSPRKKELRSLRSAKTLIKLVQDQAISKKAFKEGTFPFTIKDSSKNTLNQSLNLLSIIDSNKDGLVAVCEKENDITFYASSQFFDEAGSSSPFEPFQFEVKEGQAINKIETYSKLNFNPLNLKFNPSYPYYLAVAGAQSLVVLTLSKQGKVLSRLTVDLLLEVISQDLTIVNINWLPGSQTMLAVATRDFIKIYDLAEDNISPTHNFMIFNGYIQDFTFGKEQVIDTNGQKARTSIYVASSTGSVYFQQFTFRLKVSGQNLQTQKSDVAMIEASSLQENVNDNSDLMLTKTLQFDQSLQIQDQIPCVSIYYSQLSDLLLVTFQGGNTVCGQVENIDEKGIFSGFKINLMDDSANQSANIRTINSKYGENMVNFKDIGQIGMKKGDNTGKVLIQAISRKLNNPTASGVPMIIEISEQNVDINIMRVVQNGTGLTPSFGMTFTRNSNKNSNQLRALLLNSDGSCNSFSYTTLNQTSQDMQNDKADSSLQQETISKFFSQQSLIKKQDLPKEVKMPINFFERMKNVFNDSNLKNKLQISGDITNYFKTSKATFEAISKITSSAPVISEAAKKVIKMNLKLDMSQTDHVITGLRFKLDQNPKTLNSVSFKIFNRVIKLKTKYPNIWFDLPLCDAEVIYGATNNIIETEFTTEDVNSCPIKIFAIEVYACSRKEFGLREKLRRLEKIVGDEKELHSGASKEVQISNDEQVRNELLKTKGVPLITWKERQNALKDLDNRQIEIIMTLDVITQYIDINTRFDNTSFTNFVDKLKSFLFQSMMDQTFAQKNYLTSAVKRCLTKVLMILKPNSILGDSLNYQTIKDQIFIQILNEKLESYYNGIPMDFEDIRGFILQLSKIFRKRHQQVFAILQSHPDLISKVSQIYIRLFKQSDNNTQKDIHAIISLILANYYQQINYKIDITKEQNVQSMMTKAYDNHDFSQIFNLLLPYLINQDDQIQKLTISTILKLLNHYSKTAAKTLQYNQLPLVFYEDSSQQYQLLIVDFSPHIIRYLLGLINTYSNGNIVDVAYSLVYKIIKIFEQNCLKVYSNFRQYLIDLIVEFISNTLSKQIPENLKLYEEQNKGIGQVVYINLLLINILMQESNKNGLRIKAQKLNLDQSVREQIISQISTQSQIQLVNWSIQILKIYDLGFKEGKCSYKIKTNENIPIDIQENLNNENSGAAFAGVKLLKPIIETLPWKWHPLFIQTDNIFEILDRKIPTQVLLLIQFIIGSLKEISEELRQNLIETIRDLSLKRPASIFLSELGEQSIRQILTNNLRRQLTVDELDENALKEKVQKQINQQIKSFVVFQEFVQAFSPIYHNFIKKKVSMSFNMQFQVHNMLQQLWIKASQSSQNWNYFITEQKDQSMNLLTLLFESSLQLNEDSSLLALGLCALSFENQDSQNNQQSVVKSLKLLQADSNIDMFRLFQVTAEEKVEPYKLTNMKDAIKGIDINKLIDSITLGRNKKQIRVVAAYIIKGIYETQNQLLINNLIDKIPTLKSFGVNSYEFIAVLSYIINREIQQNKLTEDQIHFISKEIYNEISQNNQQLTAHPNLELYSTLQRVSQAFQSSISQEYISIDYQDQQQKSKDNIKSPRYGSPELFGFGGSLSQAAGKNRKITNPYMLETEACSKCYEQRSLPFQNLRLNDLKSEAKYTDSTMIIKLNATYTIKQIQMSLHDIKGVKVIKTLNFYVNNKQGVDLADMKNNWNYWKRVKSTEVEVAQKTVIVDFALPINASNLLIEFQTVTLSKPLSGKDRAPPSSGKGGPHQDQQHIQVIGIDTVIQTLPKELINKIGMPLSNNKLDIVQNNGFEKENMNCPRCGKQVQGKHGICNQCGENAQQCTFCRNINYEKPDAYLCNECGFSRFAKFDFSMTVKSGFASERIENDEQKNNANQQIEANLQTAQSSYQQLMKRRVLINQLVKRINEGQENQSLRIIQDMYGDECADVYQKMMKSLNNVKILKSEIDQFTHGNQASANDNDSQQQNIVLSQNQRIQSQQSCFSCIQEYLKAQLGFVQSTSQNLSKYYKQRGFIDLLYTNNLRMHSHSLQLPARKAICSLIQDDEEQSGLILERLQKDLFIKQDTIPAHQLSQNISQESDLILDLLDIQVKRKRAGKDNLFDQIYQYFWRIYFKALKEGRKNASIADQVGAQFMKYIRAIVKIKQNNQEEQKVDQIQADLMSKFELLFQNPEDKGLSEYFTESIQEFKDKNFVIESLIIPSSQDLREEAKEILSYLSTQKKELQPKILKQTLNVINDLLQNSSHSSEQYFDILSQLLLSQPVTKDSDSIYVDAFDILFTQIDSELNNLVSQETQKQLLGQDGFMPQISTGQLLSRLVTLVSSMVKESTYLKDKIQSNVNLVIKSFLKIRKLNLTKNKLVQNSEVELERMFKELHSEKDQDKAKFILECIKIIQSGDCDLQEMRFLFEEICKVIDPVKPDPEYMLNLHKAQSQEFYFRGKMSKNPYTSTSLGKTMADVRIKICKEMELAEPELVELLVAGKLVGMDLTIKQVYEQVFWPALCKQRDPESYEVPNIEDAPKTSLAPMSVTFRLMGIDGEATEDRVECLSDGTEADQNPANIEKKFGITQVLTQYFKGNNGENTNGIKVLLNILANFGQLHKQRYLAEWLFKLITYSLKIKANRQEISKNKQAVGLIAKRLFESVGMQSQIEGQKGVTLFDTILSILEQIVVELNLSQEEQVEGQDKMEIDQVAGDSEAATHVEIFIQIMSEACNEMTQNLVPLDKTSKKIRAVSKILPFLINKEDESAIQIIADFISQAISQVSLLDNATNQTNWTNKHKFTAQFNLERAIEILESTPVQKNFLKDQVLKQDDNIKQMLEFLISVSMREQNSEQLLNKFKLSNQNILKILHGLVKNHPESQKILQSANALDLLYNLTEAKFKEKQFILLAKEIVDSLTNKNHTNDVEVSAYLKRLIDQKNDEKKKLALRKKEEIMRQMQQKKGVNKFLKQIQTDSLQEEQGPKCIVCLDGYSKKPTDILGMYVFSKKLKISEISPNNSGFINTNGYTTVTHSNYIHFLCHQNAYRADASLKQPKKEWEGAVIRNDHTKCNNLFPMKGGNLPEDSYFSMVEKYFQILAKTVGQSDSDKVNVIMHDFKMLMKRLAYEDSFSRDSQGGGPEHNMHLIPFFMQMVCSLLKKSDKYYLQSEDRENPQFTFVQEKRLFEFLEQGMKKKQDFMQKLEEEKKYEEIEEEEKFMDNQSSSQQEEQDDDGDGQLNQMNDFKLDQIAYQLTQCIVFCQFPIWEQYKKKFLSIILCTISGMRDDKGSQNQTLKPTGQQSEYATGKKVLTISKMDSNDVQMQEDLTTVRRRRLSSDNKIDQMQRALQRIRPLLIQMRLVDLIKQRWDAKRLGLIGNEPSNAIKQELYLQKLCKELIENGNLHEAISECDEIFREYKDRMMKIGSVEEFLQDMGMMETIIQDFGTVEQYVLSHF